MLSCWQLVAFNFILSFIACTGFEDAVTVTLSVEEPIARVAPEYVSFNIDAVQWRRVNLTDEVLDLLVSPLKPAHLRVGGTQADYDVYNVGPLGQSCQNLPGQMTDFRCKEVTEEQWTNLLDFSSRNNLSLIYGLNDMFARPTKTLHPENPLCDGANGCPPRNLTNVAALLNWTSNRQAVIYGLELGNELNAVLQGTEGARTQASDIAALKELRDKIWSGKKSWLAPKLIGPDTHSWSEFTPKGLAWFEEFVNASAGVVDALTFHMYSLGAGSKLDPKNLAASFLNPDALDNSRVGAQALTNITKQHGRELWAGETSSVTMGRDNVTDTYINGFWYLDQLGAHAQLGVQVFQRQVLVANHGYPMIVVQGDGKLAPLPDYWLAVLHKQLMGQKVFGVSSSSPKIRAYCHCAAWGGITVAVLNLDDKQVVVDFDAGAGDIGVGSIQYVLEAGRQIEGAVSPLQSREVLLNGVELDLVSNETGRHLPDVYQMGKDIADTRVTMPPTSYAFIHMDSAKVAACEEPERAHSKMTVFI